MKFYIIKKSGDKWEVWSEDGSKKLGEHDTEEKAKAQLSAIEASKKRKMSLAGSELEVDFESDLQTIKDVDLFAIGVWRGANSPPEGDRYEERDLQAMVEAFNAKVVEPNIKITHGDDKEQIDVGMISNLRAQGGKLWGDFVNVPKALYELMKKGLFKARSAEVMWNMKDKAGKVWPKVLKAVALLAPGQRPAVEAISEGYTFEAVYCYESSPDRIDSAVQIHKEEARKKMALDDLIKKYGAKDEADLERILDDAQEATRRLTENEKNRKIQVRKDFDAFVEQSIKAGKLLPKEKAQMMVMFEDANFEEAKIAGLRTFIDGLDKRVDLGDHSRKDDDQKQYDSTKPPAQEVDRIVKLRMTEGKAKDYKEGLGLVKAEFPDLWKAYNASRK